MHSGHVTLPGAEFQPPRLSRQSDIWCQVASCWTLPQISSYYHYIRQQSARVVYVCDVLSGYAADPTVSDTSEPGAVIGDVEKFKEMKGLHAGMLFI